MPWACALPVCRRRHLPAHRSSWGLFWACRRTRRRRIPGTRSRRRHRRHRTRGSHAPAFRGRRVFLLPVLFSAGLIMRTAKAQEGGITVTNLDTLLRQDPLPPGTTSDNLWLGLYSDPGEWPWTYFFRTARGSEVRRADPSAMQRGHCDNSQRAFPPASCNDDIASREVTSPPDPGRQSSMLRTEAVSTVRPTAPSADRVGRVAITFGPRSASETSAAWRSKPR